MIQNEYSNNGIQRKLLSPHIFGISVYTIRIDFCRVCSTISPIFLKGLVSPAQETAVKGCIDKLERILTCATKKRPDGPPSVLSDVDPKTTEREKLKSFFAKTLATQMVQRGMVNLTEYELHKLVYAIATKTSLDDGTLAEPPKYPPAPSPPPPQQNYGYYGQGYATGPSNSSM